MHTDRQKQLQHIVDRYHTLKGEIAELKEEMKELENAAWEKCEVKAKVIRQLVKEMDWDETRRMGQRQLEESLDQCRNALGMLADLPLGEHAQARQRKKHKEQLDLEDSLAH